jgi:uncharacterized 2Fe-2S/4Fe-4S cluster protein (DUF4445 family)
VIQTKTDGKVKIIDIYPENTRPFLLGLAVDIGTTTVSALLVNLENHEILSSGSCGNGQIRYVADVRNRIIESTRAGGLLRLERAIREECLYPLVRALVTKAAKNANTGTMLTTENIYRISAAGNTTMTHLFLGVEAEYIRLEPYIPAFFDSQTLRASEIEFPANPDAEIFTAPDIGSYVGGDITAGVFASRLYKNEPLTLFIDLGTNGEIVFGNNSFMLSCACSAGPAFEGGDISCGMRATTGAIEAYKIEYDSVKNIIKTRYKVVGETGALGSSVSANGTADALDTLAADKTGAAGLCGSGLIDIIAELFRCGIINAKGKFGIENERVVHDGYGGKGFVAAENVVLWEADIDNFIRAKGAIFSAIRTMLSASEMAVEMIENVIVAGGIGSGINIESAIEIGMFPDIDRNKYSYIGNSSLTGAYSALVSNGALSKIREIAGGMTYMELSSHPSYMDEFVAACFLPHTDANLFPNIKI